MGSNCPHKALMSKNKKGLHVRRSAIFPLKIGEEQKRDVHAARSLPSSDVGEFFLIFFLISLFGTRDVPESKFAGYRISDKSTLPDIRQIYLIGYPAGGRSPVDADH